MKRNTGLQWVKVFLSFETILSINKDSIYSFEKTKANKKPRIKRKLPLSIYFIAFIYRQRTKRFLVSDCKSNSSLHMKAAVQRRSREKMF